MKSVKFGNLALEDIASIAGKDLEEIERLLEEKEASIEDLEKVKRVEKSGKNREEVIEFLNRLIEDKKVLEELNAAYRQLDDLRNSLNRIEIMEDRKNDNETVDLEETEIIRLVNEDLDEIKEFITENNIHPEDVKRIIEGEKAARGRSTVIGFLEEHLKSLKLHNDIEKSHKDFQTLLKDINSMKKDLEEFKSFFRDSEGVESSSEESQEDLDQEEQELEEKKEIVKELDVNFSEEELEEIEVEELRELREEKEHREELISRLTEEGLEEERLRNSSTSDLEKLADNVEENNSKEEDAEGVDSKNDSEEEDSGKSMEEIEEEAEEDIRELQGAVDSEEEIEVEDTSKSTQEKIEDFKDKIRRKFESEDEEDETQGLSDNKVKELLEEYRELPDTEASIKVAHVMKSYLETRLRVDHELTYGELSEKVPSERSSEMSDLSEFFSKMQEEEYRGDITVESIDEIIDTCEKVLGSEDLRS